MYLCKVVCIVNVKHAGGSVTPNIEFGQMQCLTNYNINILVHYAEALKQE